MQCTKRQTIKLTRCSVQKQCNALHKEADYARGRLKLTKYLGEIRNCGLGDTDCMLNFKFYCVGRKFHFSISITDTATQTVLFLVNIVVADVK